MYLPLLPDLHMQEEGCKVQVYVQQNVISYFKYLHIGITNKRNCYLPSLQSQRWLQRIDRKFRSAFININQFGIILDHFDTYPSIE